MRSFLADTVERQKHVSEIVLQQFNDAFLDQCIDSVTIYDLSAAMEVDHYCHETSLGRRS